jgi:hypothetical protein
MFARPDVRHFLRVDLAAPASLLLACTTQAKVPKVLQTFYNCETNVRLLRESLGDIQVLQRVSGI